MAVSLRRGLRATVSRAASRPRWRRAARNDHYDAFISYSRSADGWLAPALQTALTRFARPWYRRRALRVYRDSTNLPATPALWSSLEDAVSRSSHLIVLASPEAASSRAVAREIGWWLARRDEVPPDTAGSVLIVLTAGEACWDEAAGDFDWAITTSVPAALRGAFDEEPRWVDLRWAGADEHLTSRHPRFREAIVDLAAKLHDRDRDELDGEDLRQYRRTVRLAWEVIVALALSSDGHLLAVTGDEQAALWDVTGSAPQRLSTFRVQGSSTFAATSFIHDDQTLAINESDGVTLWDITEPARPAKLSTLHGVGGPQLSAAVTRDGRTVATGGMNTVTLWDVTEPLHPTRVAVLPALTPFGEPVYSLTFAPDGETLAVGGGSPVAFLVGPAGNVSLWNVFDRTRPTRIATLPVVAVDSNAISFVDGGRVLATASGPSLLWDLSALANLSDADHMIAVACAAAGRGLGEREWNQYAPTAPYQRTCP